MPRVTRTQQAIDAMDGATDAQILRVVEALEARLSSPRTMLSPREVAEVAGCSERAVRYALADPEGSGLRPRVVIAADSSRPYYGVSQADAEAWQPRPRGRPKHDG